MFDTDFIKIVQVGFLFNLIIVFVFFIKTGIFKFLNLFKIISRAFILKLSTYFFNFVKIDV